MMLEEQRGRRRASILWTAFAAVAISVGAWFVGVNWLGCLVFAAATVTVGIAMALIPIGADNLLPSRDQTGTDHGARRDVSRLSWTMSGRDNRVGEAPFRRLRSLAASRLALSGIDVDEPDDQQRARDAIGDLVYSVLIPEIGRPPTYGTFIKCVTALERFGEVQAAATERQQRATSAPSPTRSPHQ